MNQFKKSIKKIMKKPLNLKKILELNGCKQIEIINEDDDEGIINEYDEKLFSFEGDNTYARYQTTENIDFLLAYILPDFSKNEIKQLISMFEFSNNLFCEKIKKNQIVNIFIENEYIEFSSDLICIEINLDIYRNHPPIEINQFNNFFGGSFSLDEITIETIHNCIIIKLKESVSKYFDKKIESIDNNLINKIINESFDEFNYRINSKGLYKTNYQDLFYKNFEDFKIKYKIAIKEDNQEIYPDIKKDFFVSNDILIIENKINENKNELKELSSYFNILSSIDKPNSLKKILENIFVKDDISYILSIISVCDFINKIENPYSKDFLITVWLDVEPHISKESIFESRYFLRININKFRLSIGRNIDLYYENEIDYNNENDDQFYYMFSSSNLKKSYKHLVQSVSKKITESIQIDRKNLTWRHIILEQMKNS
jgi:hypothetical protein